MPIPGLNTSTAQDVFYTEAFKVMVRSEKEYLLKQVTEVSLDKKYDVYACRNDFYKLLRNKNVPPHMYWVTAFLNGIEDPYQSIIDMNSFLRIDESVLVKSIARANTTQA